jgi:hypothetical protein
MLATDMKDVVHEDTERIDGSAKAPDYGSRIEGIPPPNAPLKD